MTMTDNQSTVIDSGEFTVRRTVTIEATADKVWRAITEPQYISKWFAENITLDGAGLGATGVFTFDEANAIPVRIVELDPPRMIAYRWNNDDAARAGGDRPASVDDAPCLLMRFTLEPFAEGTKLTVVESGFETTLDPAFNMELHRTGWNMFLDQLVSYLESDK